MDYAVLFSDHILAEIFPATRADDFFEALFGDAEEGAFDIILKFSGFNAVAGKLHFELQLVERPGKCLACNLTYGLPEVFARHPIIDIKGVVKEIGHLLDGAATCGDWQLGDTRTVTNNMHVVPLTISLQ
jgi:hypothetical protein